MILNCPLYMSSCDSSGKAPGHRDSQPMEAMSPGAWGEGESILTSIRFVDEPGGDICFCLLESLLGVVISFLSG